MSYVIITCADTNFFHFLPAQERNIARKHGSLPIVYDMGFTPAQKARLKSQVVEIIPPEGYNKLLASGGIRSSHKATCILDCMKQFDRDVLYMDVDVLMMTALPQGCFDGADVAVTPRHPNEMRRAKPFSHGDINAGVLYFRNTPAVRDLLVAWDARCAKGLESDQLALSNILADADLKGPWGDRQANGLTVRKLDARLFNDVGSTTGHLWHFKNASRRFHKKRRWWAAVWRERLTPKSMERKIAAEHAALPVLAPNKEHKNAL